MNLMRILVMAVLGLTATFGDAVPVVFTGQVMKRFACAALIAFGLLFVSTATAAAQVLPGVYHYRVVVIDSNLCSSELTVWPKIQFFNGGVS